MAAVGGFRVALDFRGLVVSESHWRRDEERDPLGPLSVEYLDAPPILSTMACLEELILVLGPGNVFVVTHGKSAQREKNWLDYRNIWQLGLAKESVLLCGPKTGDVGKVLSSKGVKVFLSADASVLVAAASSAAAASPSPSPSPTSGSKSGGGGSFETLLFRPEDGSTPQGLSVNLPGSVRDLYKQVLCSFNASSTPRDPNWPLREQWAAAMKILSDSGAGPSLRMRPFDSKTTTWLQMRRQNERSQQKQKPDRATLENTPSDTGLTCCEDLDSTLYLYPSLEADTGRQVSLWRLMKAVVFSEDDAAAPDGGIAAGRAGGGIVYEERPWTWYEFLSGIVHEDNTVALRTVCGCRREEAADSAGVDGGAPKDPLLIIKHRENPTAVASE